MDANFVKKKSPDLSFIISPVLIKVEHMAVTKKYFFVLQYNEKLLLFKKTTTNPAPKTKPSALQKVLLRK